MTLKTYAQDGLVITEMAVASPYGLGETAFAEGVRAGQPALAPLDTSLWPVPHRTAGLIPGFDVAEVLGPKGTRSMDRLTGIAVATTGRLLDQCADGTPLAEDPEGTGLVLGTPGSVQSVMAFTHDALTGQKPFHVNPAHFPSTVLNHPTGRSAIWHGLKGPNVSVAGGAASGLLALSYASRLLRAGHANALLCGAVDEFSVQRSRLEHAVAEDAEEPLSEGAALFLLEPASKARGGGRTPRAELLGGRFRVTSGPELVAKALALCVQDLLLDTGLTAEGIALVAPTSAPGVLGAQEAAALNEVLGTVDRVELRPLLGDAGAASTALQTAVPLALAHLRPYYAGHAALVTTTDRDGTVACALLGLPEGRP
ncbi:beta-ketoacyl synthase N-terminal-like domain-containing protein [Streptomyces sp. NPDC058301]|uniref:beta-ketoacyl synthase N-terminal-like domain-containing protein n=1 Tax=Streptomyces sp. NPDC058301 TaxID=3346436 RepID=UPI0036EA80AE